MGVLKDPESEFGTPTFSVVTAVKNSDTNGTGASLVGYEGAMIVVTVGASGDTLSGSVKLELEVEESNDNSSYTDVADANLQTYVTGTNTGTFGVINSGSVDETVYVTTYRGSKKYVRPVLNFTGTHTNGTPIGATIWPFGNRNKPS